MTDQRTARPADAAAASARTGTITAVETTTVSLEASSALAVHGARGKHTGSFPSDIIGHHYYDTDVLKEPAPIDGLFAHLPAGPGLGVEPGPEVIAQFR